MNDLSGFQRDLLIVIAGLEAPKGTAVQDTLRAYYEGEVHHGRLYPNLDELVERGYLEKGKKDDRTNEYFLTEKGETAIEERRAWEDGFLDGVF